MLISQRVYSNRTRIKTLCKVFIHYFRNSQRVYSNRTRIKTGNSLHTLSTDICVKEYIPIEQGLRPLILIIVTNAHCVKEYIPIEQGLRPIISFAGISTSFVKEYIPIEQGLRPLLDFATPTSRPRSKSIFQ